MKQVKIVCTDAEAQRGHAPKEEFTSGGLTPYPESPSRYDAIREALETADWAEVVEPTPQPDAALRTVHGQDYLRFLQQASQGAARKGQALSASVFARPGGQRSSGASAGCYGFDTTPITAGTWEATRSAAYAALTAADLVSAGERAAYALCRPPGHHAGTATYGGFCYLNHAALAARRLAARGRVAVIDIDYHHGNGTQQIFYEDGEVFFLSLHADPAWEYPLYWGYADETGAGAGAGSTRNVPLPAAVETRQYLQELGSALEVVRDFRPLSLVLSAGFDGFVDDPLGSFRLTVEGYGDIGAHLADLGLPTVVIQEGGYCVEALGDLSLALLEPFAS